MLSRSLGAISKRAASASTATRVATESVTKLPNGLTVASIEQHGAASQLVVAYRAGTRYETSDSQGVAHLLRNTIGNDSTSYPGLQLVWNSAQRGADIKSSVSRDVLSVQVSCPRTDVQTVLSILGELANPACKPWNIEDTYETLPADAAYRCPVARTVDGLHEAAYRNGPLGHNSLVQGNTPGWKKVLEFKEKYISSGNAVVIGVNIDHDVLVQGANSFRLADGSAAASDKSKYFGGEKRIDAQTPVTFVALAGEGVGLANVNEVAAQTVASEVLLAAAKKTGANVSPVNVSYSDSGLVGVTFNAPHDAINQLVKNVAGAFKTVKVDDASLAVPKAKAALKVLNAAETASSIAFDQAVQYLATGNAVSPSEFAKAIKNVSSADVQKVLSRVSAKPSLSSVGRTANVPYLDEL